MISEKSSNKVYILLHGYPDTEKIWQDYTKIIKESDPFADIWTPSFLDFDKKKIDSFVFEILQKIKITGIKEIVFIAHDVGCPLAVILAEHLRTKTKALVLIGGLSIKQFAMRATNKKQILKSWYMFLMQPKFLPELLTKYFSQQLLMIPEKLGQHNFRKEKKGLEGFWIYRELLKAVPESLQARGKIHAPVLALWGKRDAFVLPPTQEEFNRQFLKSEIRIMEGDHWFHLENPAQTYSHMKDFFERHS